MPENQQEFKSHSLSWYSKLSGSLNLLQNLYVVVVVGIKDLMRISSHPAAARTPK